MAKDSTQYQQEDKVAISRRIFLLSPIALAFAPSVPATAAPAVTPMPFAHDPIRRAALDHLVGSVKRLIDLKRKFETVNGPDLDFQLSQHCFMGNGEMWNAVDVDDYNAIEAAVLASIERSAHEVKEMCAGRHKSMIGIHCSQGFAVEQIGFGSIPHSPQLDGSPKTGKALEALILPILSKGI